MKTLTFQEADAWCKQRQIETDARGAAVLRSGDFHVRRFEIPKEASRQLWFSRSIESALRPWSECLLWVTTLGVWPSSENWHLYYRLRESYGDHRRIDDAPAHLFLNFEANDLISFLQIGLSAGWDVSLVTVKDYVRVLVSHDEWVEFGMRDSLELDRLTAEMAASKVKARSTS